MRYGISYLGKYLGELDILEEFRKRVEKERTSRIFCKVKCFCGKEFECLLKSVKNGNTKSCGCLNRKILKEKATKHGDTDPITKKPSPELSVFYGMKKRCVNSNQKCFNLYGGRGVEFRFSSFQEFINEVGRRPTKNHSIDRIDPNGHYEKGNVRWATLEEQSRNKRRSVYLSLKGERLHLIEACQKYNIPCYRYYNGKKLGHSLNQIFNIKEESCVLA